VRLTLGWLLAPALLGLVAFGLAVAAAGRLGGTAPGAPPEYAQRRDCDEVWYAQPEDPPVKLCWQELAGVPNGTTPTP
jgi:hypothetical protein